MIIALRLITARAHNALLRELAVEALLLYSEFAGKMLYMYKGAIAVWLTSGGNEIAYNTSCDLVTIPLQVLCHNAFGFDASGSQVTSLA